MHIPPKTMYPPPSLSIHPSIHPSLNSIPRPLRSRRLAQVALDSGLEGLGVRADDLGDLLAVLEQQEGGHGADAELLRDVWDLVDVELVEAGGGVFVGEPVEGGMLVWG